MTAETNVGGELLDVEASGRLHPSIDPIATSEQVRERYETLWHEITAPESIGFGERHRLDARIRRLNDLGFDVAELSVVQEEGGSQIRVTPKVVDVGHHSRRLLRLTGLDVEENQARRLLNDLDAYRVQIGLAERPTRSSWRTAGSPRCSSRSPAWCRPSCAASSSPRRCSTRCSSTAGS